jgi:hypothetical protein
MAYDDVRDKVIVLNYTWLFYEKNSLHVGIKRLWFIIKRHRLW